MFKLKRPGYATRLICASSSAKRSVWPVTFSYLTPAALRVARWAARGGAMVHPALRLVDVGADKGLGVVSLRKLPAGTPLMVVPDRLCLTTSLEDRQTLYHSQETPLQQLYYMIAKGLIDDHSPWKTYLEFLHDMSTQYVGRQSTVAGDDVDEDTFLSQRPALQSEVDRLLGGNAVRLVGVPNASFVDKEVLQTPRGRVAWGRWRQAQRALQQALPHFASQTAGWAISMALSRSVAAAGETSDAGELRIIPLVDFINHSADLPNAHMVNIDASSVTSRSAGTRSTYLDGNAAKHRRNSRAEWGGRDAIPLHGGGCQVRAQSAIEQLRQTPPFEWKEEQQGRTLLVAVRDVQPGEEVTLKYSDLGTDDAAGIDMWRLRWGFCEMTPTAQRRRGRVVRYRQSITMTRLDELALSLLGLQQVK